MTAPWVQDLVCTSHGPALKHDEYVMLTDICNEWCETQMRDDSSPKHVDSDPKDIWHTRIEPLNCRRRDEEDSHCGETLLVEKRMSPEILAP